MTTILGKQTDSLHARIPQEVLEELDIVASSMGRSRNWVFNEALQQYLETQKWQIELIEDRLAESQRKHATFISHHKVLKRQEKRLKAKLSV